MSSDARTLAAIRQLIEDVPQESQAYNLIQFKRRGVQPPGALYINLDTFLAVNIFPLAANPAIVVRLRVLGPDGTVCVHSETITAAGAGSVTKQIFGLSEGFLLDACVSAVGTTLQAGQCFVRIDLQHSNQSGAAPNVTLCAGYVSNTSTLSYPTMQPVSSVDGAGLILESTIASPAAGADFSFTIPSNVRMQIISLIGLFTASSQAATRTAYLNIDDGTSNIWAAGPAASQTASLAYNYLAGSGLPGNSLIAGQIQWNMPTALVLLPTWRIRSTVLSIQTNDQWSALRMTSRQWLEL